MKSRMLIILLLAGIAIQSCSRALSPYEAANHPKGKHCRDIK
ncbi:MAG: hypothetical protein WBC06_10460 [Chitinophagaceae bacterium]